MNQAISIGEEMRFSISRPRRKRGKSYFEPLAGPSLRPAWDCSINWTSRHARVSDFFALTNRLIA